MHVSRLERLIAGIDADSEDPREGNEALSALLAVIAEDVHSRAAAAREGVLTDFARRMAHARRHLSPYLLAATLAALKQQRKAALALIGRNAALELAGRKQAAIMAWRPRRRNSTPMNGGDNKGKPPLHEPRLEK